MYFRLGRHFAFAALARMLFFKTETGPVTELYYISGDRALAKKAWQKTWRISIPKVPLRSLDSCC